LVESNAGDHEGQVVSTVADVDQVFSPKEQIMVYRIIQEALTNARKHAGAKRVRLSIEPRGDRLCFVVEDDGAGFDVDRTARRDAPDRGLGLTTMRERARMLGGMLEVDSGAGRGTRITLGVPVPASAAHEVR
jgi:signal transduction histidine kinase